MSGLAGRVGRFSGPSLLCSLFSIHPSPQPSPPSHDKPQYTWSSSTSRLKKLSRVRSATNQPCTFLASQDTVGIIQGFSRVMTRLAGRVRGFSKSRGSSLVGSEDVRNLTDWVGSGRVGSDYPDPSRAARNDSTREPPW